MLLALHGLMKGQCRLERGRRTGEDGVAGDGAGVVIEYDGQPRACAGPGGVDDLDVQLGVVALPLLVRAAGGAPVDQLEPVAVGGVAFERDCAQSGIDGGNDRPDGRVAGGGNAAVERDGPDPSVDERDGRRRAAEREAFDRADDFGRERMAPAVRAWLAAQGRDRAADAESCRPPLQRAEWDAGLTGDPGEGNTVARLQPTSRAASSAVRPFERASEAIASLSAMTSGSDKGRPKRVPPCRAAAMPAFTRSTISSRSYSAKVASMFSIRRPDVVVGSIPSEMDLRCTPRSRSRFTVFKTSIKDRPSLSTRHTTTVSPGSTYARSFFIPGRSIAVLLPEVTSANTSRFCTPASTSASSCNFAS
jgi:hypothetical protein